MVIRATVLVISAAYTSSRSIPIDGTAMSIAQVFSLGPQSALAGDRSPLGPNLALCHNEPLCKAANASDNVASAKGEDSI